MPITIKPRDYQKNAVEQICHFKNCYLEAPTGSGKTNIIAYLCDRFPEESILIIVPSTTLITQTVNRLHSVAGIVAGEWGGHKKAIHRVTVATWQSLKTIPARVWGIIIVDEMHHSGPETILFRDLSERITYDRLYMVSATPFRADKAETMAMLKLTEFNQVTIPIEALYEGGYLIRPTIDFIQTGLEITDGTYLNSWQRQMFNENQKLGVFYNYIANHSDRNAFLIDHIYATKSDCNLVLTYTTDHAECLHKRYINDHGYRNDAAMVIHGKLHKKESARLLAEINECEQVTVFGTQSFLGEGVDIPRLSSVYFASPFGGSGTKPIQFLGRVLRPFPGKEKVQCFDYVDGGRESMAWSRYHKYKRIKPIILRKPT